MECAQYVKRASTPEFGASLTCPTDVGPSAAMFWPKAMCVVWMRPSYKNLTSTIEHNGELRSSKATRTLLHRSLQLAVTAVW